MFKLVKDTISKNLIAFKVFLEKVLKFPLCYQILGFKATFILMPLLNNCFLEKKNSKKDLIGLINPTSFKIIITLLAKIIAI